ncbi:mitochondrial PGP phosphatase-domain-containing protein [Amylocarpus encephaloides]|uniref:Mitochondrial PGP phosphatase-domain-containing protein n=1 Tax=Amylocarpus encephaloides TaxID=45428 RepID=A0A9P7YSW3_9HELO|nr:mitochondrial PGP phosphatase-domain-containing protein [Amylocarpus encephaloides]
MDMSSFNLSATLSLFRLITKPSLILPQATIRNFNELPIPLNKAFEGKYKNVDIRAVVLDKDNCFAWPKENTVWKEYEPHLNRLRATHTTTLLIVSNTAGSTSDPTLSQSRLLATTTSIPVLTHTLKKPSCGPDIMAYFKSHPATGVTRPDQIAVVGDRLTTDVMMANMMGAYSVFVADGTMGREGLGVLAKMEQGVASFLLRSGFEAPDPSSPFEK